MYIIPAIDILDRKVVRLREGDYEQITAYDVSLESMLEQFESNGTNFIQIIDLNGARGDFSNQKYVLNALKKTNLKIQYGGGVRSIDKVKELIDSGFHRIIIGTQALTEENFLEELSKEICGKDSCSDQIVIAVDIRDGVIMHSGWTEASHYTPIEYIGKCTSLGYFRFLCTDISKDGKMQGSGLALYKSIKEQIPFIKLIASGGIRSMDDIRELQAAQLEATVVGKAIYENKISIETIKEWNLQALVSF